MGDFVQELRQNLMEVHEAARNALKLSARYQKKYYDHKARSRALEAGQPIWLLNPIRKKGVCSKLTSPWKGPYIVVKKIDDVTYLVQEGPRKTAKVHHIDRLKKYEGSSPPKWFKMPAATEGAWKK